MYFSAIQPHASASQPAIFAMDLRLGCHPHTSNSSRSFRPRRSSKTVSSGGQVICQLDQLYPVQDLEKSGKKAFWR